MLHCLASQTTMCLPCGGCVVIPRVQVHRRKELLRSGTGQCAHPRLAGDDRSRVCGSAECLLWVHLRRSHLPSSAACSGAASSVGRDESPAAGPLTRCSCCWVLTLTEVSMQSSKRWCAAAFTSQLIGFMSCTHVGTRCVCSSEMWAHRRVWSARGARGLLAAR